MGVEMGFGEVQAALVIFKRLSFMELYFLAIVFFRQTVSLDEGADIAQNGIGLGYEIGFAFMFGQCLQAFKGGQSRLESGAVLSFAGMIAGQGKLQQGRTEGRVLGRGKQFPGMGGQEGVGFSLGEVGESPCKENPALEK